MDINVLLFGIGNTIIILIVSYRVTAYLKKREHDERVARAKQEIHYIKLDAVIFALAEASVEPHKSEFQKAYDRRYQELLKDRRNINEMAEQI